MTTMKVILKRLQKKMLRKDMEGCNEVKFKPIEFDGFKFYKVSIADKMSAIEKRLLR